jgi:hypothetical protein
LLTVGETQWKGSRDAITLPVSHTGMLLSARVAAAVAGFLRHGTFTRLSD